MRRRLERRQPSALSLSLSPFARSWSTSAAATRLHAQAARPRCVRPSLGGLQTDSVRAVDLAKTPVSSLVRPSPAPPPPLPQPNWPRVGVGPNWAPRARSSAPATNRLLDGALISLCLWPSSANCSPSSFRVVVMTLASLASGQLARQLISTRRGPALRPSLGGRLWSVEWRVCGRARIGPHAGQEEAAGGHQCLTMCVCVCVRQLRCNGSAPESSSACVGLEARARAQANNEQQLAARADKTLSVGPRGPAARSQHNNDNSRAQ